MGRVKLVDVSPGAIVRLPDGTVWRRAWGISAGVDGIKYKLVPLVGSRWESRDTEVEIITEEVLP